MQAEREAQEKVARPLPKDTLWVRFVFVDHAGIPKCKAVHRDGFDGRARAGVGLAKGVLALDPSGALHPESGLSPVGECRLVPDLSTLTALPFARGQAMVSSKLMYSSDGIGVPELHWISAIDGRRVIGEALGELVSRGELDLAAAEATGENVLRATATRLYRL
jgi:glutamine synthetase